MSEAMNARLHNLDARLEKLASLCRERELHLNELVKNHPATVRWNGFAGGSFTKDVFKLELETPICKELVPKDNLRVTMRNVHDGTQHALMCRVASIADRDSDEGVSSSLLIVKGVVTNFADVDGSACQTL